MVTFVLEISRISQLLLTRLTKFFWTQNLFGPKIFLDPKFFGPKFSWTQNFLDPSFLGPKIYLEQKFIGPRIIFNQKYLWTKLGPQSYFQLIWTSYWTHGTISTHKSSLNRQIREAVRIRRRGGAGNILNSRATAATSPDWWWGRMIINHWRSSKLRSRRRMKSYEDSWRIWIPRGKQRSQGSRN